MLESSEAPSIKTRPLPVRARGRPLARIIGCRAGGGLARAKATAAGMLPDCAERAAHARACIARLHSKIGAQ